MQLNWILNAILIVVVGTLLLRLAGRNSISQLTTSELIIMIILGPLLSRPIENKGLGMTFGIAIVLICTVFAIQFIKMKFNRLNAFLTGKPVSIIENGVINAANMKRLRITPDNLDMRLRQAGYAANDLKSATIEVSGELSFKLMPLKQPATKEDIQQLIQMIESTFSNSHVISEEQPHLRN